MRGFVVGTKPGDSVEVWFTAGGKASAHFTYAAVVESTKPGADPRQRGLLRRAAQRRADRRAEVPRLLHAPRSTPPASPTTSTTSTRTAAAPPDPLGILAHYSHVVWYTGDDYVPREPDAPGGSGITKLAVDTQNAVRDFLNDGGKLFFTGKNAGRVFAEGYTYNPFQAEEHTYCQNDNPSCIIVQDDFLQYYLGAYRYVGGGGEDDDGDAVPRPGHVRPVRPAEPRRSTARTPPQNNDNTATLLTTSSVLDPAQLPAVRRLAARWRRGMRPFASPFDPHDGDWFLSAGTDDAGLQAPAQAVRDPGGRRRR